MTDYLSKYNDYESSLQLDDSAKLLISNIASQCADNFELRKEPAAIGKEDEVIQIVETQQEFIQIYSKMEQEMENNLNLQYSRHCDLIALQIERIGTISSKIQKANEILDSLQSKYEFVQSKTMGLQTACENLVDEQAHMVTVTQEIDDKLKYFKEFDQVSKMLNAPGEALVLDPKFIPMLQKLDQCLSFVAGHSHYKESDLYAMRYRQAMTRSLTLVKLYFVDSIRTLQNDVTLKVNSKSSELLSENLQVSLFYVRFKALAATTQPLLFELEQRCLPNVEYFALLNDCIYSYITCRKTLLTRYAVEKFRERKPNDTLVQFAAASATYAIQLANDEVSLFKSFFTQGYEHLNNYIAEYSALFSSSLKSLIIHQGNVEILVELCSSFIFMQKNESNGAERILDAVLEDTQIRLQQIAGEFISTDIKRFKPREQEFLLLARMQGSNLN